MDARPGGGANFTVVDARPDQLTLSLSEGSTWVEVREVHQARPLSALRCLAPESLVEYTSGLGEYQDSEYWFDCKRIGLSCCD